MMDLIAQTPSLETVFLNRLPRNSSKLRQLDQNLHRSNLSLVRKT
jgi:hypothetical protein